MLQAVNQAPVLLGDLQNLVEGHGPCTVLLNEVPGLENPTSEVLAGWLWQRIGERLPGLVRVTVFETCTTRCDYEGPEG